MNDEDMKENIKKELEGSPTSKIYVDPKLNIRSKDDILKWIDDKLRLDNLSLTDKIYYRSIKYHFYNDSNIINQIRTGIKDLRDFCTTNFPTMKGKEDE